jgi:hypothetical protein
MILSLAVCTICIIGTLTIVLVLVEEEKNN